MPREEKHDTEAWIKSLLADVTPEQWLALMRCFARGMSERHPALLLEIVLAEAERRRKRQEFPARDYPKFVGDVLAELDLRLWPARRD